MKKPTLQAGDLFCVRSTGVLPYSILAVEKFLSKDNDAKYGHSGVILNGQGDTFEALTRARKNNLKAYKGKKVIIARPIYARGQSRITPELVSSALQLTISRNEGKFYPFWRIPLFLYPPLAKYLSWDGRFLVCSETVAQFEHSLGIITGPYTGRTPDDLADRWSRAWTHIVRFEGVW